jgi:hypothetical protein
VPLNSTFENDNEIIDDPTHAKEDFINSISRGGLRKPSDCIYISCVHASSLNRYIFSNEELKKLILEAKNSRDTVIDSFMKMIENDTNASELLSIKCTKGHTHTKYLRRVAFTIFNINMKNYVSELNDAIATSKKRKTPAAKTSKSAKKIRKLQGQGSSE